MQNIMYVDEFALFLVWSKSKKPRYIFSAKFYIFLICFPDEGVFVGNGMCVLLELDFGCNTQQT